MTKPVSWPSINDPAYKGEVSHMRTQLEAMIRKMQSSPDFATEVAAHLTYVTDTVIPSL